MLLGCSPWLYVMEWSGCVACPGKGDAVSDLNQPLPEPRPLHDRCHVSAVLVDATAPASTLGVVDGCLNLLRAAFLPTTYRFNQLFSGKGLIADICPPQCQRQEGVTPCRPAHPR